jgi:hypothetical protein
MNIPTNITPKLVEEVKHLRAKKKLHSRVCSALADAIRGLFPDWVYVSEICQTPGGRNDAILFESGGESICFELFASSSQVDRDLLLLRDSPAKKKIAILLDIGIDPSIAKAYYRKRPHKPYPCIWVSDVLAPDQRGLLKIKLCQYVFQNEIARSITILHQLQQTSQQRTLETWRDKGIEIYTGDPEQAPTFPGVMSRLAVSHMLKLGVALQACEEAARMVSENFDFLIRQILFGVPMLMVWDGRHCSIMDLSDYECWLLGAISLSDADQVVVLLNKLYSQMKEAYLGDLPEPGDMNRMIGMMEEGKRMLAVLEERRRTSGEGMAIPTLTPTEEGDL